MITAKELSVIQDTDFILNKNSAIQKIQILLSDIRIELEIIANKQPWLLHDELDFKKGKISRGENYKGMPFLILDYPKLFKKKSTFAFRTLFLWGNFFSCTLHLEGNSLEKFKNKISKNIFILRNKSWYFCVNKNQWEHLYETHNYKLIELIDLATVQNQINNHQFVKLSSFIKVNEIHNLKSFVTNAFNEIMEVLNA